MRRPRLEGAAEPDPEDGEGAFASLLAGCRAGDERAFARLWRSLHPPLLRYLRVVAGASAEDIASETWLEVAKSLDRFEGGEAGFRGWLFAIARHRVIDASRRNGRRVVTTALDAHSDAALPDEDVAAIVEGRMSTRSALEMIGRLPPAQAEAVSLRVIADLSVTDVAALMGREPGAVRVLTHRGLQRLGRWLEAEATVGEPGRRV